MPIGKCHNLYYNFYTASNLQTGDMHVRDNINSLAIIYNMSFISECLLLDGFTVEYIFFIVNIGKYIACMCIECTV